MNAAFWSLLVAAVVLGLSPPSLASLGGEISSVKKDQQLFAKIVQQK